jgi:guanylate kinase
LTVRISPLLSAAKNIIMKGKMLIVSAPSGSGKSTIVQWLMQEHPELKLYFSISCTSRAPRGTEQNGVEYFFLSPEEFRNKIAKNEFLEYEEVYENRFYGTLKQQVENQREAGQNVVFDVDVKGGVNIKKYYGDEALSLFIQPPSVDELRRRLEGRATDTPEAIAERLAKAEYEMTFAPQFDRVIVNDDLETAKQETLRIVKDFLGRERLGFLEAHLIRYTQDILLWHRLFRSNAGWMRYG